jgi:hypothetical protein
VGWLLGRVLRIRDGYFRFLVIAFAALWEGIELIPALRHGFVLLALPAFVVRAATVVCLGCGVSLVVLAIRLADQPDAEPAGVRERLDVLDGDDEGFIERFA